MRDPLDELDCREQLRLPVLPRCGSGWRLVLLFALILAALIWL
ncbi:MAG: hypothetical protein ACOCZK_03045 [Planctomycetota bacterium]